MDLLVKIAAELRQLATTRAQSRDEASLAARLALTLAANYLGDLALRRRDDREEQKADREAQKAIAIACAEAGSKLRAIAPVLSTEFHQFGAFWSSGGATKGLSVARLNEHVSRLGQLLRDENLEIS